jgi:NhaP-type Na+/H+ or K+/H+ antiporter
MCETTWFLIVGGIFVVMGIAGSLLKRLPCSSAMLYLAIGAALGTPGAGILALDIFRDAHLLRVLTEVALLVSLFAIGLRLRVPLANPLWGLPLRLGVLAMLITIPLLTAFGMVVLDLPVGPALLIAAILAPTDPVLAHDVQVQDSRDQDQMRFALSGEGGLNDGAAMPFALLGIALCNQPDRPIAAALSPIFMAHALWGGVGAIGIGATLGWATTHGVAWLRTRHAQALGLEGFFALGLIVLSYGAAELAHTYGFLAVFAAGVAMRRVEHRASGERTAQATIGTLDPQNVQATAAHPDKAHAYMAESILGFTIELEKIAEMATMIVIGNVLTTLPAPLLSQRNAMVAAVLFLLVRPLAVGISLAGSRASPAQRRLMSWFGIRGIGSFYYTAFAVEHGVQASTAIVPTALFVVTASVVVHGVSATPLMNWYQRWRQAHQ